jgi:hypothetical protein
VTETKIIEEIWRRNDRRHAELGERNTHTAGGEAFWRTYFLVGLTKMIMAEGMCTTYV